MNWWHYSLSLLFPAIAISSFLHGGNGTWALVIVAFGVIPFLELFLQPVIDNRSPTEEARTRKNPLFDLLPIMLVPIQWGVLILFLYLTSIGHFIGIFETVGATASLAVCCGTFGINIGHELGHRRNPWIQDLGKLALMSSFYVHFHIEHNLGHHRNVATAEDPATAHRHEPIYTFWVRSISGGFLSAWRLNAQWVTRLLTVQVMIWLGLFFIFGPQPTSLAFLGAIGGILLLEVVNYIEHYGLTRSKLSSGHYESPRPAHSWNSDHPLGRVVLLELSRHSDHHANPRRPYSQLRSWPTAPQLPTGYPGMILLAMVPPLYFRLMDPLLERWEEDRAYGSEVILA